MNDFPDLLNSASRLLVEVEASDNAPALSVSELSVALKTIVEQHFGHVRLRGEISGYKRAASGHGYLTLKDDKAVIDAVIWKGQAAHLSFRPEDGIEVIATGRLTTYPGRSKYQLVIDRMELAGEGARMLLLERLKQALAAEGLFAPERKQPLPFLPGIIGVVTSPTGAVIRDILHRLADRCPTHVLVWPVLVQGQGAAEQIAAALNGFSALPAAGLLPRPDLVIVARGGGSIEDLWPFNEEIVVRAVAACSMPVISAIGHETDTTLCDYAADIRAPTPTAAAEMAVPVRADLIAGLQERRLRMLRAARRYHERAAERLAVLAHRLPGPGQWFDPQRQRVDDLGERVRRALGQRLAEARGELARASGALRPAALSHRLAADRDRLDQLWRLAEALHPDQPLARGYARVERRTGGVVTSAAAARAAQLLALHFADGSVAVRLEHGADTKYDPSKPVHPLLL